MATVTMIAPKDLHPGTLRVAAYCRVSSDSTDQLHSYATQVKAYTELIENHDGWELVDIYADEGLTGTRMDKREDFQRLMRDCRKGKIDKVIVKSISRFARNTHDCLVSLRELMRMGVNVQFEEDHIDTETLTTELMVSVSGALAQEESISISKNQRISYQRRMERGEFICCKPPFGYRMTDGKHLEVDPNEAKLVQWVYESYLSGHSAEWIAEEMSKKGIPTSTGTTYWQKSGIIYLLTNEKYVGDSLCQKTFTASFPFERKRNHGEKDQYYVENTHPAIISREMFERAQELRERKTQRTVRPKIQTPLTMKIICDQCGTPFIRREGKSGLVAWVCRKHDKHTDACPNGRVPEREIYAAFLRMYQRLKQNEDTILKPVLTQLAALDAAIHRGNPAMMAINQEIAQTTEQSYKISQLQEKGLLDADACAVKLAAISARLTDLRAERRRLLKNEDIDEAVNEIKQTIARIQNGPEQMKSFDETLFRELVEQIRSESPTCIRFRLYGGMEFTERLREVSR
jgi:DNA invertase Pin-like site-specific DNA recombinase